MNDNTRIELEALVTERKGMQAENEYWIAKGELLKFRLEDFQELAERIRALHEPPKFVVPAEVDIDGLDCKPGKIIVGVALQCSLCGLPGVGGKRSGDICGRELPTREEPCPGVLRKG
jgi:hypothetical protein